MILERLGERARLRLGGRAPAPGLREVRDGDRTGVRRLRRVAGAREQESQQVARRFAGRQRLRGQARAEFLFQAQHELHARQAVEAEFLLQRAVERQPCRRDVRPRFLRDRGDDFQQALGLDLCSGRIHLGGAGRQDLNTTPAAAPESAPFSQVTSPFTTLYSMPCDRITMRFAPPGRS